jgi:hypothetical protein
MGLTNAVRDVIATSLFSGNAPTVAFTTAAFIGVGTNSSTAYASTQTNLQAAGAGTAKRNAMMGGFPTNPSGGQLVYKASFATGEANFAWNEWGVFSAAGSGDPPTGATMLNRRVESLGTKTSAQTWEITATLNFTAG